ncbi:MFS transporter [Cellulomonas phragmiteti]|uniref:MFS transporter n=1 Tax=Cellulomonas phragmiteti TaxID=478780 RepID=A0ABQ4DIF8_9CELL|nr:MFS transporter [Cellulomonas phragmiteti]GIG39135.1 MFS transporter [Cellulomonas phragmiteti]
MTTDRPTLAPGTTGSLVHHPDFRRLWAGDALGQLGAQLTAFALPILAVQQLAASEWEMGVLTAAEYAAFLVIGLPAGAWVDRLRKRRTLIVADLVRATVLAAVVVTALSGHASVPMLVVAALVVSTATVFFDVAHQSYVPGLVGLDHLVEGNSKLQATASAAQVLAPALGGLLLRVIAAPALIAVTAVSYVVSAVAVGRIRQHETLPPAAERRPLRTEIAEGLRFVVHQPYLRRIVVCTSLSNLAGAVSAAVVVIYVLRTLDLGTAAFGTVLSAGAVGGLTGAVLAGRVTQRIGEGRTIPLAALLMAPTAALTPLASTGLAPAIVLLVTGGAASGFAVVVYNVAQVSFRQRVCPPRLLGRMNASVRFIVWGTMPVGALLGGWLGTRVGVVPTLWASVGLMTLAALPVALSPLLRLRDLPGATTVADTPRSDGAA